MSDLYKTLDLKERIFGLINTRACCMYERRVGCVKTRAEAARRSHGVVCFRPSAAVTKAKRELTRNSDH